MKSFLLDIVKFAFILLVGAVFVIFVLPNTPRANESLLMTGIEKDSLVQNQLPPRMILVGGSNIGMGLNSQLIKDSLNVNPINAAIHAGIGLSYMMHNIQQNAKKGDVIVIIPEYGHFNADGGYGSEEELRMVLDVSYANNKYLDYKQWFYASKHIFSYMGSKIRVTGYVYNRPSEYYVYTKYAYNEYGDAVYHWTLPRIVGEPNNTILDDYNEDMMNSFIEIIHDMENRGIEVLVSYPPIRESFSKETYSKIQKEYERNFLNTLGTPEDFILSDDLFYDQGYHLTKNGADIRTNKLIHLIQSYEKKEKANSPAIS